MRDVRILVVDDDEAILEVLRAWFALFDCAVDTASDALAAVRMIKARAYDVLITDLRMPNLDGHQLVTIFKEACADGEVIVLTGEGTMDDAIMALREGRAFDFMQKPVRDFQRLNEVIERALERRARLKRPAPVPPPPEHIEALSAREREIVALLAEGLDNAMIADRLCLSEKTVKNHLTRVYEKLKVTNRTQAVVTCQTYGLM